MIPQQIKTDRQQKHQTPSKINHENNTKKMYKHRKKLQGKSH